MRGLPPILAVLAKIATLLAADSAKVLLLVHHRIKASWCEQ
jgi:hypothetical protein